MLRSQLCTLESIRSPQLRNWSDRLRPMWDPTGEDPREVMVHRKMWEWLFIAEALAEREMLGADRRGLGFGVGKEPLVSLFAAQGCSMATDLDPQQAKAEGWTETGEEYAGGVDALCIPALCDPGIFAERTDYRHVDMTDIPEDLHGFDFTWSSCALEHLGSLQAGADFVVDSLACLAPGGVAVHTTEYRVSSGTATPTTTVDSGATVLYRRRDIEDLAALIGALGYRMDLDLTEGTSPEDRHVDVPPFSDTHLRTTLGEYVTTSIGLIIEAPPA